MTIPIATRVEIQRYTDIYRYTDYTMEPQNSAGEFDMKSKSQNALMTVAREGFIELHTTHFCMVICTICQTPYHCRGRIDNLWFGNIETDQQSTLVEIRNYFGGVLYTIAELKQVQQSGRL